ELGTSRTARAAVEQELPKLAGAEVDGTLAPDQRLKIRSAIDASFVSAFQLVMMRAAAVVLAAAASGVLIPSRAAASRVSRSMPYSHQAYGDARRSCCRSRCRPRLRPPLGAEHPRDRAPSRAAS